MKTVGMQRKMKLNKSTNLKLYEWKVYETK